MNQQADKFEPEDFAPEQPKPDRWHTWAGRFISMGIGLIIGLGVGQLSTEPASTEQASVKPISELDARESALDQREADIEAREAALNVEETKIAENTIPGDGTYLVNQEIKPGEYKSSGPADDCYWSRLSGTSGTLDDIITNGYGAGSKLVTIDKQDYAFETMGCGSWKLVKTK